MKKILLTLLIAILMFATVGLVSCKSEETPNNDSTNTEQTPTSPTPEQPTPSNPTPEQPENTDIEITGVSFSNKTFTYNGTQYEILVDGTIPNGVSISYQNNKGTNAGTYNATAVLSGSGYITKTLSATLTINKATITGVTLTGKTIDYNGNKHSITVNGNIPNGVNVAYQNNEATDAGTYNATAVLSGANYNTLTLNATLKINKINFTGLNFSNETFEYDGNEKTIEVTGIAPTGTNITYSCNEVSSITNSATNSGSYTIVATITNKNYVTLTLSAVMKIQGSEDERFIYKLNGNLYFANALDNDYLYVYDGSKLTRISSDIPYNFNVYNNEIYYRSKAFYSNSIKYVSLSNSGTNTTYSTSVVTSVKGEYLVNNGSVFYYAVNSLTQASSGIYKVDISASEPTAVKIFEGKTKYLQYYNNALYFADGTNDYKLTKLSLTNNTKTLLRDEKITTLTYSNGYLFYTVNNLLGDYIENYNLSNNKYTKLTVDAGANLTLIGSTLYYINVDLLTSYVNGNGIYYVNAYPSINMNLPGTKLVGDNTFSSLTKISSNEIAYYRVSDQMLITHNVNTNQTVEVLNGFTAPEYSVLSTGSKTASYNGNLYFMDLHKDKCLYSYNPTTNKFSKLTANKVTDFAINGDYLYYNMVSLLVNNDLYRVNLKLGGEPEKVSTYDCVDVVFDDNNVFYVEQNAVGARTAIRQITNNAEDIMLYSKGVNNLRVYNGYLYFEDGNKIYKMSTTNYVKDEVTLVFDEKDVGEFEIYNGIIYFREIGLINKHLSKVNVDGTGYAQIITKTDPVDIIIDNGYIYYYSDTVSADKAGIFKVKIGETTATQILTRSVDSKSYYPYGLSILGNDIYFIDYALSGVLSDSHLYKVNITTKTITKVA